MTSSPFPESSWLLNREELFALYRADQDQPFPEEKGVRVVPRAEGASGHRDFVLLEDGLGMIVSDIRFEQVTTVEHPDRPLLKFHYRLSGGSGIDIDTLPPSRVAEYAGGALFMPTSMRKRETAYAGKHEQSVTVACTPQWLMDRFGECLADASPALVQYATGQTDRFFYLPITMRSSISQAVNALLQCELEGPMRLHLFHAKAMELLVYSLDVLIQERSQPEFIEHRISRKDFEQLRDARRILTHELHDSPKVGQLAERVGMTEAKLMQLFRKLYGETIFDFSQRVRMEYAAKLLEITERPITDIAYEIGYDYPSNFTTAFKRHFGVPPKAVRLHGMSKLPHKKAPVSA